MNFTVGVAGRGALTIGSKGFGSFIFYFTLPVVTKEGLLLDAVATSETGFLRIFIVAHGKFF
jgi:hypothetical protein